jgi:hypothetical protein
MDKQEPTLWGAITTFGLFLLACFIPVVTNDPKTKGWLIGILLLGSGLCSIVWHDEVVEMNRQMQRGSFWAMSDTGHHIAAICWGVGVIVFGWVSILVIAR